MISNSRQGKDRLGNGNADGETGRFGDGETTETGRLGDKEMGGRLR